MTVRFLGSGDAFGSGGLFQTCILVEAPSARFLIDCGASSLIGMKRLGVDARSIDAILLTHLHGGGQCRTHGCPAPGHSSAREEATAPAHDRLKELQSEIAELERRIERQVMNLEAEDATPTLRRRVGARIAGLEEALEERRQHANTLAAQASEAPPTAADLATALDRLPLLAERLQDLPQPELRARPRGSLCSIARQARKPAVSTCSSRIYVTCMSTVSRTARTRGFKNEFWVWPTS